MNLLDRMARLLRADAHGMVDALEDRGLLLRQHLRDAETEVLGKRARVEALGLEAGRLAEEAERREERIAALDEDVTLAMAGGKDDLARFAAGQLLAERRERETLELRQRAVEQATTRMNEKLAEQERALDTLKTRVRNWIASRERDAHERRVGSTPVADEEVELELMRRRSAPGGAS
ncbi:MAG: PspA/IM30 family protein [Myxococcota bacterium]